MDGEPQLRIVRGTPTAEELAALVGALTTLNAPTTAATPTRSRWAASARPTGAGLRPGVDAWRHSLR
jgi:hypothetical protein